MGEKIFGSVGSAKPGALILSDGARRYYGGDQAWFAEAEVKLQKRKIKKGCSAAAAANILAYLAASDPKYAPLYKGKMTKTDFTAHLCEVAEHLTPGAFGIWSAGRFARGAKSFARSRGVRLEAELLKGGGADDAAGFIGKALKDGFPAAMLIGFNRSMKQVECVYPDGEGMSGSFQAHWVTVTELFREKDGFFVTAYSWGRRARISLNDWAENERFRKALVCLR